MIQIDFLLIWNNKETVCFIILIYSHKDLNNNFIINVKKVTFLFINIQLKYSYLNVY